MTQLTKSMLNRLTLPQVQEIACQLDIEVSGLSEKAWIIEDILEAQESPQVLNLQRMHDELLREEKATGGLRYDAISQARQSLKVLL